MELRQLSFFLAIAEKSNMSEASRALHVSQPALSAALKDLESELGFALFERKGRRPILNENGRYFAERVHSVFAILNDARETVIDGIEERQRMINCRTSIPLGRLDKNIFAGFHHQFSSAIIRMGFSDSVLVGHEQSAVGLAFFGSQEVLEENERRARIGFERYVVALPANHPLTACKEIPLTEPPVAAEAQLF